MKNRDEKGRFIKGHVLPRASLEKMKAKLKSRIPWNKDLKLSDSYKEKIRKGVLQTYTDRPELIEIISKKTKEGMLKNNASEKIKIARKKQIIKHGFKKGQVSYMKDKKHTEKAKEKNRLAHINKPLSEKHKKKIKIAANLPERIEKSRKNGIELCKKMKKKNTLPEKNLRNILLSSNFTFQEQISLPKNKPMSVVDFYIPDKKLVIYADGDYWHNLPNYKSRDRRQNKILKQNGYKVLRFWEHEINTSPEYCLNTIKSIL